MSDFGIFRGFSEKLFQGELPNNLGLIGSQSIYIYVFDKFSNATIGYSLRQLSSTYTGDAIEVRRSSDNTTQDIGFVKNELDTTSLESFCSGTNGYVTTWYDQSGNGNDATQTTAANQPQIVSSGSVILENGKPSLEFDGANSFLNISIPNPFGSSYYYAHIVNVFLQNTRQTFFDYRSTYPINSYYENGIYRIEGKLNDGTGGNSQIGDINMIYNNQYLISSNTDSNNTKIRVNDTLKSYNQTSSSLNGTMAIGRNNFSSGVLYLDGRMSEFLLYDANLSDINEQLMSQYINDFYSIY